MSDVAVIRSATPADADAIAWIGVTAWQTAYRGLVPDEHLDALDWRERAVVRREQLDRAAADRVVTYVVLDPASVVGFVASGPDRDEDRRAAGGLEIYALYVVPSGWGHGLGRALLERAIADVPVGVPVTLWVLAGNTRARAFYERQGFVSDGAEKPISIGGRDLLEVRYRLDIHRQVAKPSDR